MSATNDTDTEVTEAPEVTETGDTEPSRVARLAAGFSPLRAAVAIVVLALAASTAYFGYQWHQQGQADQTAAADRSAALAAGKSYAVDLSSYDYRNLNANFKSVTANATGSFAKQYKLVSGNLISMISKYHATSKAQVIGEAVQSINGDQAVILLFVDQSITNTSVKKPQVDSNRMRMTLMRSGGRWRLDNVQLQ